MSNSLSTAISQDHILKNDPTLYSSGRRVEYERVNGPWNFVHKKRDLRFYASCFKKKNTFRRGRGHLAHGLKRGGGV
jgi:hypothetical protein